jgi:cytochrome c-type biogenesis protein CcmH/NrfG
MNWNRFSLFKLPNKHRRFEYIPRYYDPRKEELEKKVKAAQKKPGEEDGQRREISFRQQTADKWGNTEFKMQAMRSNIRLIVIFIIVLIAFYYLYQYLDDAAYFLDNQKPE